MTKKNINGLIVAVAMLLGIVLLFWGIDKNESTLLSRTKGAVFMIIAGSALFAGSFAALIIMNGWGTRRD